MADLIKDAAEKQSRLVSAMESVIAAARELEFALSDNWPFGIMRAHSSLRKALAELDLAKGE